MRRSCPHCGEEREFAGRPGDRVTCPACQEEVRLPLEAPTGRSVTCSECGQEQRTGAAPGRKATCQGCGAAIRVPLRSAEPSELRSVVCPHCQSERATPAPPGRKTRCAECGASFRVPLREAGETTASPQAAVRTDSPCFGCGETFPLSWAACPECGLARGGARDAAVEASNRWVLGLAASVALAIVYGTLRWGIYEGGGPVWLQPRPFAGLVLGSLALGGGLRAWWVGRARR